MKITIQYFDGCPNWKIADERVKNVIRASSAHVDLDYQLIDSPETAERLGFHGSPTILIDGRDLFATGEEPVGLSCRTYRTEVGIQGAPTEQQIRLALT